MTPCTVREICAAVNGVLLQGSDAAVTQVSTDSRSVPAGALFVPLVESGSTGTPTLERRWSPARRAA